MFNTKTIRIALTAVLGILALTGCDKSKTLSDGTVVYTSPEAAQEAHLEKMEPIWAKFPEATAHSIVLEDGSKVTIPEAEYPGKISDFKTMKAFKAFNRSRFDKATFKKIRAACDREESRFAALHNSYGGLSLDPMDSLCYQAGEESR